jgi:hypothetical protein
MSEIIEMWRRNRAGPELTLGGELDAEKVEEFQRRRLVVEEGAGKEGRRISRPQAPGLTDRAPPLRDLGGTDGKF